MSMLQVVRTLKRVEKKATHLMSHDIFINLQLKMVGLKPNTGWLKIPVNLKNGMKWPRIAVMSKPNINMGCFYVKEA